MKKQRTQRDFLLIVALYKRVFNNNYLLKMSCETEILLMFDFIEKFRYLMQLHQIIQIEKKIHQTIFFVANIISNFENFKNAFFKFNNHTSIFFKIILFICLCDFKH